MTANANVHPEAHVNANDPGRSSSGTSSPGNSGTPAADIPVADIPAAVTTETHTSAETSSATTAAPSAPPAVTTYTPPSAEQLARIASSNMLRLLKQTRLTQKEMARKLGVAPASMTDYCKGRRLPNMEFFVALKEQFGISIDEFVTKDLTPSDTLVPPKTQVFDQQLLETYKKYCCSQFLYYFDTSKTKGRDIQAPRDSVLYGILYIYENPDSTEVPEFKCAAILGIDDRDEVSRLKSKLDKIKDPGKILEYISSNYESAAYYGDFTLSQLYGFVSISHANTDKALMIFHRVDNNKPEIIGGIGTINSVSKGREHVPVVQFIGMSKYPLSMSVEEIHYNLLLDYPSFEADQEMVDEMITNFKALYADPDGAICKGFSDYEKAIMVKSTLDKYVRTALTRNMFRYGKITGTTDDDQWYHAIKKTSIKNSQH